MWQSRAGLGNSPRTVLEELARIQSHDVVLPTASHGLRQAARCRRLHVSTGRQLGFPCPSAGASPNTSCGHPLPAPDPAARTQNEVPTFQLRY